MIKFQPDTPLVNINLGEATLVKTSKTLPHVVDLRDYQENIDSIQLALNNLRTIAISGETVHFLISKVQQVREKLGALIPKNRARRGPRKYS